MVKPWFVLGAVVTVGGIMSGGPGQVLARTTVEADTEDVAAALDELAAAGAPVSTARLTEILAESPRRGHTGVWSGRSGWSRERLADHTVRLRWSTTQLTVKGRWRRDWQRHAAVAGAVIFGRQRWRLAAGTLGMTHGFGMLVGAPGRAPSLTADGGLAARSRGLGPWAGSDVPQVVRGVGAVGRWRLWQIQVVSGHRTAAAATGQPTTIVQVSGAGPRWQTAATVLADPAESGLSLAGQVSRRPGDMSWEVAWRRPRGSSSALTAAVVQAGWRPHATLRLEMQAGWADLGPRPVLGQKPALFGGWAGQGVAVRGTWRATTGMGLKVLVHRGRPRDDVSAQRRRVRTLVDAQLTRTWPAGWTGECRWRQSGTETAAWSARFPWLPPSVTERDGRRVVSLKAGWQGGPGRMQVLWRRLHLARTEQGVGWASGGSRSLLTLAGRLRLGRAVLLRGTWTTSWGAAVDLVSAVVPFGGFVLPRHWGHWRAEQILGGEFLAGAWQVQAAVSRRLPEPAAGPDSSPEHWAAWLQAAWRW